MSLILYVVIGAVIGWGMTAAFDIRASKQATIIYGALGGLVGGLVLGLVLSIIGLLAGIIGAVLGAFLLIWLWRTFF